MPPIALDRDTVDPKTKWGVRQVLAACGGRGVTFQRLIASLERNGPDPAILEMALSLPEDQYDRFHERFKRTPKRMLPRTRRGYR